MRSDSDDTAAASGAACATNCAAEHGRESVTKSDIHRTMKDLRVTHLASYTNLCRALLPDQGDVCENVRGHFGSESSQ